MTLQFSKHFIKQSRKLPPKLRQKLTQRLELFAKQPQHTNLRDHRLAGKYKNYRSIDITGDVRALYLARGDEAIFEMVGTHSQLYG